MSRPLAVSMGVPQGSILGLTLFSVYINDALADGESLIHLYADDTILYTSGPSLDTVLTSCVEPSRIRDREYSLKLITITQR